MIKVLLVDDHKLVRDGLKFHLEESDRYTVVAEASDAHEAMRQLEQHTVDIVLTDISMPGMTGIELAKTISRDYPDIKVLALTVLGDAQYIRQMMMAGAMGYLLKTGDEAEVFAALDSVMAGNPYYSEEVTHTVMQQLSGKSKPSAITPGAEIPLTDRELEVLRLIVQEYSNQEIANALFISPRTVDAHKRNLLEKTGAKNVAGLVVYAYNRQLFEEL